MRENGCVKRGRTYADCSAPVCTGAALKKSCSRPSKQRAPQGNTQPQNTLK